MKAVWQIGMRVVVALVLVVGGSLVMTAQAQAAVARHVQSTAPLQRMNAPTSNYQCPSQDKYGFNLGDQNTSSDPIVCGYPGYGFYCYYSAVDGHLVQDQDVGLCPDSAVSTIPACQGKTATIYVRNGTIVGGKDNGKPYKGKLRGTSDPDVIVGTEGNDSITGSDKNDTICGLGGDDIIHGNDGDDTIDGGSGNDKIYGDDGADTLHGGADNDKLYGGAANDALYGDDGNDTLKGESGTDSFDGGAGTDTATDYDRSKGETAVNIP